MKLGRGMMPRTTLSAAWWRRAALSAALLLTAGCSAMGGVGSGNCEQRVVDKLRKEHPNAQWAKVDSGSVDQRRRDDGSIGITGQGRVKTAKGAVRRFNFNCIYDQQRRRLTQVQYNVN